jgi:hypothetical protein
MADAQQTGTSPANPHPKPPKAKEDPKPHWSRAAGGFAALAALAAFAFGVGSFTDLKDTLTGQRIERSQGLRAYIYSVNRACKIYLATLDT